MSQNLLKQMEKQTRKQTKKQTNNKQRNKSIKLGAGWSHKLSTSLNTSFELGLESPQVIEIVRSSYWIGSWKVVNSWQTFDCVFVCVFLSLFLCLFVCCLCVSEVDGTGSWDVTTLITQECTHNLNKLPEGHTSYQTQHAKSIDLGLGKSQSCLNSNIDLLNWLVEGRNKSSTLSRSSKYDKKHKWLSQIITGCGKCYQFFPFPSAVLFV